MSRMLRGLLLGLLPICCLISQSASAASTERVSVGIAGLQADGQNNGASISSDGRVVAFESLSRNLVQDDGNGTFDVFVHDRLTGTTERVNISTAGGQGNDSGGSPSISADGRFVAFESTASNLVAGDTNWEPDAFVRDRIGHTTERISVSNSEGQSFRGGSAPSISGDGRFVAFTSYGLAPGETSGWPQVYVRDRQNGTTTRVSVSNSGAVGDGAHDDPSISGDGRFVVFVSSSTNLVADDSNVKEDIFVRDLIAGTTERVSVSSAEAEASGRSLKPSISADGRFVAFYSEANLGPAANGMAGIFVRDREAGTTERVSLGRFGQQANSVGYSAQISGNGRFVAFSASDPNLVPADTNGQMDVFVRDRHAGTTFRVSVGNSGAQANRESGEPSISGDGLFVAFESSATNLVAGDTNGQLDVFVRDRGFAVNDLLADFGATGLWERLNNAGPWVKINNSSPLAIDTGDFDGNGKDEVIGSFSGLGLLARYNNTGSWRTLHATVPTRFITGDFDGNGSDDLAVEFPNSGRWIRYNNANSWTPIYIPATQGFAVGDLDGDGKDELIADLGRGGISVYYNNTSWKKILDRSPLRIVTGDLDGDGKDELIADFGVGGLWGRYNNASWRKLHVSTAEGLATGDLDGSGQAELIADFGTDGLQVLYNNGTTWRKMHNNSPTSIATADLDNNGQAELIADLGSIGIWARYNNATWLRLHTWPTQAIVAGGFD